MPEPGTKAVSDRWLFLFIGGCCGALDQSRHGITALYPVHAANLSDGFGSFAPYACRAGIFYARNFASKRHSPGL